MLLADILAVVPTVLTISEPMTCSAASVLLEDPIGVVVFTPAGAPVLFSVAVTPLIGRVATKAVSLTTDVVVVAEGMAELLPLCAVGSRTLLNDYIPWSHRPRGAPTSVPLFVR